MKTLALTTAALALATLAGAAMAADSTQPAGNGAAMEKCYGVAMAGKNDCKAGAGDQLRWQCEEGLRRHALEKRPHAAPAHRSRHPCGMGSLTPIKS